MAFFVTACHEDIDIFEPAALSSGDIARFFGSVQSTPQQYSWEVSEAQTLALPGKGQAIIPAHAFEQADGSPVSGRVQASVLSISDKGGLIRQNLGTAAGMQLLELAGMAFIEVRQDGRPLRLAAGKNIRIQLASAAYDPQLRLFTAAPSESGALDWVESQAGENAILPAEVFDPESGRWLSGFEIQATTLGWLQCARYVSHMSGKVPACVKLPLGFSARNTAVFLALQNVNSVVAFTDFDEALPRVCRQGLPAGSKAELIVIAEGDGGEYYFARQPIIVTEHLTINIAPQKALLADILYALDNL